jgi:DNA-binding NarL/FixJ family response regulator
MSYPALSVLESGVTAEMRETSLTTEVSRESSTTPLRVAVFSNQELIRAGLATLLQKHSERVVAMDAPRSMLGHDLVLFDLVSALGEARAPSLRQLELLLQRHVVVAVTRDPCDDLAIQARALGCADVVPVSITSDELFDVLETVAGQARAAQVGYTPRRLLTRRETEIIELVARGLSNTEIAQELFLSVNSVKTYIRTAYRKMGVTTRSQAVLWAVQGGLGSGMSRERR